MGEGNDFGGVETFQGELDETQVFEIDVMDDVENECFLSSLPSTVWQTLFRSEKSWKTDAKRTSIV